MIWARSVGAMALVVTILTASATHAEETPAPAERSWLRQPVQHSSSNATASQHTLGRWSAVALLVGLSGFALWKSARRQKTMPSATSSRIQVGSAAKIAPKAHLVVVAVNGRSMLLAATDVNVTRLMWLDEDADDGDSANDVDSSPGAAAQLATPGAPTISASHSNENSRAVHSSLKTPRASRASKQAREASRSASTFREILTDIIGLEPRDRAMGSVGISAAETLAVATEDRYVGRGARRTNATPVDRGVFSAGPMVNCEGQAAGLIARLNRTQS